MLNKKIVGKCSICGGVVSIPICSDEEIREVLSTNN